MQTEIIPASSSGSGFEDVCSYAYYKELPFVGKAEPDFRPADWDSKQWLHYFRSRILRGSAGSVAAVGLLILTFVAFISWRLAACCKRKTSIQSRKHLSRQSGCVSGPVWKVTITLCALAGIALALTGMGVVNRSLMHEGWQVISDLGSKTKELTGAARFLVQESSRLNPIMQQLNQLMDTNVDFDDLTKQAMCVGSFLANLGEPQQLRDSIAFMGQQLKIMKPSLDRLDSSLTSLTETELPKTYPVMRDVQAARPSLYRWSTTLQEYQRRLLAIPEQEPEAKFNSTVVKKLVALRPLLAMRTWATDVSHIQDKFYQYDDIRKSGVWQALPWNMFGYTNMVPNMADWAIKPVSQALGIINKQYLQGGGACLSRLVQQVKKIDANIAQLGNDTKAAFQQVEVLDSMLHQVYNGLITPVTYKQSLDDLASTMKAQPNTSSIVMAMLIGNQSVSDFPDVATTLQQYNQARDAIAATLDPIKQVDTALEFYANYTWNYASVTQAVNLAAGAVTNAIRVLEAAAADTGVARSSMFARLLREQGQALQAGTGEFQASMDAVNDVYKEVPPADAFLPLLDSMVAFFQALPEDRYQVVQPVVQYLNTLLDNTVLQPNANWRKVNRTVSGFGNATAVLENQTTHRLNKIENKWKKPTTQKYDIGYKAVWALYLLLACSLGFLLVSVWMELQWGRPTASILVLATATLLLLLGVVWSALIIMLNDTCANMANVVVSPRMDPKVQNLLSFYMSTQNSSSDVSTALQEAGILDVNMLYSTLNNATYNLTQGMAASNFTLRPTLRNIAKSSVGLTSDLSDGIDSLLRVADWQSLHGLYLSARSWLCCNVASVAYYQWCFILAAGLLGWASVMLVSAVIAHHDRNEGRLPDDLFDMELGQKQGRSEDQFKPKAGDKEPDSKADTPEVSPFTLRPLTFTKPFAARSSPLTSSSSSQQISTYENDTFEDDGNSMDIHVQPSNIPQFSWPGPANSASLEKSCLTQNSSSEGGFMGSSWLWRNSSPEETSESGDSGGRNSRQMEVLNTGGSGSSGSSSDARGGRADALHTGSSMTSIRTSLSTIFDTIDVNAHAKLPASQGMSAPTPLTMTPNRDMPPRPPSSTFSLGLSPATSRAGTAGVVVTPPRPASHTSSNSSTPLGSPCSFDSGTNSVPATPASHKSDIVASNASTPAATGISTSEIVAATPTNLLPAVQHAMMSSARSGTAATGISSVPQASAVHGVTATAVTALPRAATFHGVTGSSAPNTPMARVSVFSSSASWSPASVPAAPLGSSTVHLGLQTPLTGASQATQVGQLLVPAGTPNADAMVTPERLTVPAGTPMSDAMVTPERPIRWTAATPAHTSSPCSFASDHSSSTNSTPAGSTTYTPTPTGGAAVLPASTPAGSTSITPTPTGGVVVLPASTPAGSTNVTQTPTGGASVLPVSVQAAPLTFTPPPGSSPGSPSRDSSATQPRAEAGTPQPTSRLRRTFRRLYAEGDEQRVGAEREPAGSTVVPAGSSSESEDDKIAVDASWQSEGSEFSMQLPMPPSSAAE